MTIETTLSPQLLLAFGMPGWQEMLILGVILLIPVLVTGTVLLVLYLTGVIGGKKK